MAEKVSSNTGHLDYDSAIPTCLQNEKINHLPCQLLLKKLLYSGYKNLIFQI